MIDKQLRSEIALRKPTISAAEPLNFDNPIARFIKSGSMCNLLCLGGSYKLLRGHPPSPPRTLARLNVGTFKRY